MRTHMKSMSYWKDRQSDLNSKLIRTRDEDYDIALNDVEKTLLDLGEEMVAEKGLGSSSFVSTANGSLLSNESEYYEVRRPVAPANIEEPRILAPNPLPPEPLR